jgi:hypothetical protein
MRVWVGVTVAVEEEPGVSVGFKVHVGRGECVGVRVSVAVDVEVGVSVLGSGVPVGRDVRAGLEKNDMDRIKIRIKDKPNKASMGINDSLLECLLSILPVKLEIDPKSH